MLRIIGDTELFFNSVIDDFLALSTVIKRAIKFISSGPHTDRHDQSNASDTWRLFYN